LILVPPVAGRDQDLTSMNLGFLFMTMDWVYPKNIILNAIYFTP